MGLISLSTTGPTKNGKPLLHAVYVLMCSDAPDKLYLKVGMSMRPVQRLMELGTSSPLAPKAFSYVEVGERQKAMMAERLIHKGLAQFRHSGEWFLFNPQDAEHKALFNAVLRQVLDAVRSSSREWQKIDLNQLKALADRQKKIVPMLVSGNKRRQLLKAARREMDQYRMG